MKMRLELWLKKNDNGKSDCFDLTIGQEKVLTGEIEKLHVCGTCRECVFYIPPSGGSDWIHGQCLHHINSHKNGLNSRPEDFGCIHWEKKEDK